MDRKTNRDSFMGRGTCCLAPTYGTLVAIEIAIKDNMGAAANPAWQHNLPHILISFAAQRAAATPPVPAAQLNSLSTRLGNELSQLICLDLSGNRSVVPGKSYPYMRYLLHEADGTPADTKETEIVAVNNTASAIITTLQTLYGVTT